MERIIKIFFVILLIANISCRRQTLEEPSQITALIPISFDWSESNVPVLETRAVSVFFYPESGGEPVVHVSNDIHNTKVELLAGKYSVLIFNETIYESSWTGVSFEGTDRYETFEAVARNNDDARGNELYQKKQANEKVILNPEPLAAWSLDNFEVTQDMISRTRSKSKSESRSMTHEQTKAVDKALNVFVGVKLMPRTANVTVNMKVCNLNNAHVLTGAIKGLSTRVNMVSGKASCQKSTHLFTFCDENYEWDDHQNIHGMAKHSFVSFGRMPTADSCYSFQLNAVRHSGETIDPWECDITDQINNSQDKNLIVNIGVDDNIPDIGEYKDGVDIGDWNDENIEIE